MSEKYDEKLERHGGDIEMIAAQYDIQLDSLIDFSVNVNPLGAPEILAEIIQEGIALIGRYPDSASSRLCGKLSGRLCVSPRQIIVGNGTTELIYLISRCFRPSRALLLQPTFTEYQRSLSVISVAQASCLRRSKPAACSTRMRLGYLVAHHIPKLTESNRAQYKEHYAKG